MKKKAVRILGVVCFCIAMLFFVKALPVLAIAGPTSNSTINPSYVHANRNLIEQGDVLIYGEYVIPYTTIPSEGADKTYILSLIADNATLGTITPYVLMNNGYNEGVFSFYFTAADNLTWGTAYTIRIGQSPAYFTSPTTNDYQMLLSAYSTSTDQETNQSQLAINVINAAGRLESAYTLEGYTFLDTSPGGTILYSPTGETYFSGAIYGLRSMAPSLFMVQVLDVQSVGPSWSTNQTDNYTLRFDGTWVGTDIDATGTQFGLEGSMLMSVLFILPLCVGAVILSAWKFKKTEAGLIAAALFLIMGLLMGWLSAALFCTIYQTMGMYIAYLWFYSRG